MTAYIVLLPLIVLSIIISLIFLIRSQRKVIDILVDEIEYLKEYSDGQKEKDLIELNVFHTKIIDALNDKICALEQQLENKENEK